MLKSSPILLSWQDYCLSYKQLLLLSRDCFHTMELSLAHTELAWAIPHSDPTHPNIIFLKCNRLNWLTIWCSIFCLGSLNTLVKNSNKEYDSVIVNVRWNECFMASWPLCGVGVMTCGGFFAGGILVQLHLPIYWGFGQVLIGLVGPILVFSRCPSGRTAGLIWVTGSC